MAHIGQLHRDILAQLSDQGRAPGTLLELARRLVDVHPETTLHEIIAIVRLITQQDTSLRPVAVRLLGNQSFMLHSATESAA